MKRNRSNDPSLFDDSERNEVPFADDKSDSFGENSSTNAREASVRDNEVIGQSETREVSRLKLVVFLVLLGSASVVATAVFFYLDWSENEKFATAFEDDANKVLEAIGTSLEKTLGLLDSVAVSLVSSAERNNQTWPFVKMEDFAVKMGKILPLTDTISINVLPIVTPDNRREWEAYAMANDQWVDEGMTMQEAWDGYYGPVVYNGIKDNSVIHTDFANIPYDENRTFLPLWQNFPVIPNTTWTLNWDWMSLSFNKTYQTCIANHKATVSTTYMTPTPGDEVERAETDVWAEYYKDYIPETEEVEEPMSDLSYPIVNDISRISMAGAEDYTPANHEVVGIIVTSMYWRALISGILPDGSKGIHIVFSHCEGRFTYMIDGQNVVYLGVGDKHEEAYNGYVIRDKLYHLSSYGVRKSVYSGAKIDQDFCPFTVHLYPSKEMRDRFTSGLPILSTVVVLVVFAFTSFVFYWYDSKVERRQSIVMNSATRSAAIVSSLFPSTVRDKLYPVQEKASSKKKHSTFTTEAVKGKDHMLGDQNEEDAVPGNTSITGSPIAELYPDTTVLFADIAGFTSWSSTRQPTEVFTLLETLYAGFDEIAKHRGVFKVETIGDCYVAVVGLPTPRKNHAVVMARFASDCRNKMQELTVELEKKLGEGTKDLALRIGLNSGPTTAGVLRGEKSRFQLFGDTVNTAARMESNGEKNRIHVSQRTADLIVLAGKAHWLTPRAERVFAKGKGMMTCFWCEPKAESVHSLESGSTLAENTPVSCPEPNPLQDRLIDWNVDMFTGLLKDVMKRRNGSENKMNEWSSKASADLRTSPGQPIHEINDVLSCLNQKTKLKPSRRELDVHPKVAKQLRELIAAVANLYLPNPFHNFEHCSHVAMSTKKLLDRIAEQEVASQNDVPSIATNSCGMFADPLTRFAMVFAALIHDVDHPGVSNAQLVQERHGLALAYSDRSAAEQNSIDASWDLLMSPKYADLRGTLFSSKSDLVQFRQVVVNVVLATDLFDKDFKAMREARWETSFHVDSFGDKDAAKRRATIIIDLVIQASDVSHTMQHFTVYKKWNMCLLAEMYAAFKNGRTFKDPTEGWYEGELWFFDNYVIPLAERLRECEVFGVSGDEFLDYAKGNRLEWAANGREIVRSAVESLAGSSR